MAENLMFTVLPEMAWYLANRTSTVVKLDVIGSWVFRVGSRTYIVEELDLAKRYLTVVLLDASEGRRVVALGKILGEDA